MLSGSACNEKVGFDGDSHQTVLEGKKQQIIYYCEHQGSLTLNLVVHKAVPISFRFAKS